MGIALNLYIAFGSVAILTILTLPIHELGKIFCLLVSLQLISRSREEEMKGYYEVKKIKLCIIKRCHNKTHQTLLEKGEGQRV
jgi:hypothetical protein